MLGFSAEWFHVYWSKKKTWMKIVHTINIDASCSSYWLGITKILTTWLFVFILSINNSDDGHCYGNFYAFLSWKVIKRPKWLHKIIQMLTVYIIIMIEGRKKFDWCYCFYWTKVWIDGDEYHWNRNVSFQKCLKWWIQRLQEKSEQVIVYTEQWWS